MKVSIKKTHQFSPLIPDDQVLEFQSKISTMKKASFSLLACNYHLMEELKMGKLCNEVKSRYTRAHMNNVGLSLRP